MRFNFQPVGPIPKLYAGAPLIGPPKPGGIATQAFVCYAVAHKVLGCLMGKHGTVEMTGQTFGHLTVVRRAGSIRKGPKRKKKYAVWLCKCSCGERVEVIGQHLRNGQRKACALNGHYWNTNPYPHLYPNEYGTWKSMHARCYEKGRRHYALYGGRGIKVCARWHVFQKFVEDMGRKPTLEHTIDRKDNDKGYEPSNCRWATRAEQARNLRRNIYVEYEGQRTLLLDVVAKLGLNRGIVYGRLKMGWPLAEALSLPIRPRNPNGKRKRKKSKRNKQAFDDLPKVWEPS